MPIGRHAAIPLREITLRASRSSGPGGQRTIARIGLTRDRDDHRDDYLAEVGRYWNVDGIDPRERPEAPPDLSP